jgi:hypothetical protein
MWLNRLRWTAYLAYYLRGQARFPFKSLDAIKRAQARRVQSIVFHAYRTVISKYQRSWLGLIPKGSGE